MMSTPTVTIRPMLLAQIPIGMRLKAEANWNQTEADWQRLLGMDFGGCFMAEYDDEPVGTLVTTVFGKVAWISMVLVDARMRGKGIGTALMRHALNYLDGRGVVSVRLDATPLGRPLYEKLGFVAEYHLTRFEGVLPATSAVSEIFPFRRELRDEIIAYDRRVTGTDRAKLLYLLFEEHADEFRIVMRHGEIAGYLTSRPGARARQLGPCIADREAGQQLLADACRRHAGEFVFLDVPDTNPAAIEMAESLDLTVQRPFLRMVRGAAVIDHPECIWASSGPEKG